MQFTIIVRNYAVENEWPNFKNRVALLIKWFAQLFAYALIDTMLLAFTYSASKPGKRVIIPNTVGLEVQYFTTNGNIQAAAAR